MTEQINISTTQTFPQGQRLVVLGAGESGAGAAYLAKQKGFDVFVSDFGAIADKYIIIPG